MSSDDSRTAALRVLVVTNLWPTPSRPTRGIFVRRLVEALHSEQSVSLQVVHVGREGAGGLHASRRAVASAARQRSPDLLHVIYGLSGLALPLRGGIPVVATLCGSDLLWGPVARSPRGLLEYAVSIMLAAQAEAITVESAALRSALPSARLREKVSIISPGVDRSLFRPQSRLECRRRLGWPRDEIAVLFPADPARELKRFALAEAAVSCLQVQMPKARLRVLGGVLPDDVPLHVNAADCVLVTSRWEGGPLAFYESLACGVPIVTVPVGYAQTWSSNSRYVQVASATPADLGRALQDTVEAGLAHDIPSSIAIPTPGAAAPEMVAVYRKAALAR